MAPPGRSSWATRVDGAVQVVGIAVRCMPIREGLRSLHVERARPGVTPTLRIGLGPAAEDPTGCTWSWSSGGDPAGKRPGAASGSQHLELTPGDTLTLVVEPSGSEVRGSDLALLIARAGSGAPTPVCLEAKGRSAIHGHWSDPDACARFVASWPGHLEHLAASRRDAIEDQARLSRFFADFDEQTLASRGELVSLQFYLERRLETRRAFALRPTPAAPRFPRLPEPPDEAAERVQAREVTHLIQHLAQTHFGPEPSEVARRLDWAFEQFVTGRLAVHHCDFALSAQLARSGVPDSTLFFQLPELGLTCLDEGIETDFWLRHLGSFVRAGHLLLESTAPPGFRPSDYPAKPEALAFEGERTFPDARRRELRAEYRARYWSEDEQRWKSTLLAARLGLLVARGFKGPTLELDVASLPIDEPLDLRPQGRGVQADGASSW